jgi:hypothetical protein
MFGIVDEYKVLNEGEVFVQITDEDGTKTVLEGFIAIFKILMSVHGFDR